MGVRLSYVWGAAGKIGMIEAVGGKHKESRGVYHETQYVSRILTTVSQTVLSRHVLHNTHP